MARAGVPDQQILPRELLLEVYTRTHGIPRLINAVCDNLLVTTFAMEQKVATVAMLDEVSQRPAAGMDRLCPRASGPFSVWHGRRAAFRNILLAARRLTAPRQLPHRTHHELWHTRNDEKGRSAVLR